METIHLLREVLSRVLASPETQNDEQELFDELMVQKPRLLKLFEVGPRNPQEQREIESGMCIYACCKTFLIVHLGKPTINNKATAVNADFARQVIFLSQQLDCSEKYVAGILHHVMLDNPNIGSLRCMEMTVAEFHQRRRHLVDSLRFLLEATEAATLTDASQNYRRIATFVLSELLPGTKSSAGTVTLASKLFKEIEQLDVVIGKADAARKNAGSNTVAPTGQGTHPTSSYIRVTESEYRRSRTWIGHSQCPLRIPQV